MTKNRILCASALAFTGFFVLFFGGDTPYALFFAACALVLLSLLHALAARLALKAEFSVSSRAVAKGGVLELRASVKSRAPIFFPYVRVVAPKSGAFAVEGEFGQEGVPPLGTWSGGLRLAARFCGLHDPNIGSVRVMDFLGVVSLRLPATLAPMVEVYPRVAPTAPPWPAGSSDESLGVGSRLDAEESSDLSDVRAYAEGDDMRKIHWKATARMQALLTKRFESEGKRTVSVLVDLTPPSLGGEQGMRAKDMAIEAAVAVARGCLLSGFGVRLCHFGAGGEAEAVAARDAAMFGALYERLASVEFVPGPDAEALVDAAMHGAGGPQDVCVITAALDAPELWEFIGEDAAAAAAAVSAGVAGPGESVGAAHGMGPGESAGAARGMGPDAAAAAGSQVSGSAGSQAFGVAGSQAFGVAGGDSAGEARQGAARARALLSRLEGIAESGGSVCLIRVTLAHMCSSRMWRDRVFACDMSPRGTIDAALACYAAGHRGAARGEQAPAGRDVAQDAAQGGAQGGAYGGAYGAAQGGAYGGAHGAAQGGAYGVAQGGAQGGAYGVAQGGIGGRR